MNAQEVEEWLNQREEEDEKERKGPPSSSPPNFHTECWYLTLQAHHLSVVPCIRRYQRRLRALRELQKMVDELEKTQAQWSANPGMASRNKILLKRYKAQLKVLPLKRNQVSGIDVIHRKHVLFY